MALKGATKHCCWSVCNSDSRYPERLPPETSFIRFPKPRNVKDNMTEWQKHQEQLKTEKSKIWLHACGRQEFNDVSQIKKDTYICSLHFIGGNGPTEINPNPLTATLTAEQLAKRCTNKRRQKLECVRLM